MTSPAVPTVIGNFERPGPLGGHRVYGWNGMLAQAAESHARPADYNGTDGRAATALAASGALPGILGADDALVESRWTTELNRIQWARCASQRPRSVERRRSARSRIFPFHTFPRASLWVSSRPLTPALHAATALSNPRFLAFPRLGPVRK